MSGPLAHRRICGLCGRAFAIVMPPDEEETERDKLCPARLTLPASNGGASAAAGGGGDRLLTAREAAVVLNLSTDFLYKHEAAKPFRVRIGSEVRFSLVGIQRFIERHRGR